jgi:SAM-dependent methyltransferase
MQICNPMTNVELDEVISAMGLASGARVLDVACGYGELLFRAAAQADISGVGIDLSPWMITAAAEHARVRAPNANLHWVLGEARDFTTAPAPDVAVCIGAEWIWHDFSGTVRALSQRLGPGGVAVIGAARLHKDADQDEVRSQRGFVESLDDMQETLKHNGLVAQHRVDPDDAGWDAYLARTATAAADWAELSPGPRAARWLEEQVDWQQARDRDRDVMGWSVWIARKGGPSA